MTGDRARAVVLVEGLSDRLAVEAAARRLDHDLAAAGVAVVPMGGVHALARFLDHFGPHGSRRAIAGLYDSGEEGIVRHALVRGGLASGNPTVDLEPLGFYACVVDLEDELIRAMGAAAVEAIIAAQGEINAFRSLQRQPQWRGQPVEAQMRRFMGSGSTRKTRYARLLVEALDPAHIPQPLARLIAHVDPA